MQAETDRIEFVQNALAASGAELEIDADGSRILRLIVGSTIQSELDLDMPDTIVTDYLRVCQSAILDFAPGEAFRVIHLGIGAASLVRSLSSRYPRSEHSLVDAAPDVCEPLLRLVPLPATFRGDIVYDDARTALVRSRVLDRAPFDAAMVDLWSGDRIAPHVSSLEFYRALSDLLTESGVLVVNVPNAPGGEYAPAQAATVRALFPRIAVVAHTFVLEGTHPGNVMIVGWGEEASASSGGEPDARSWIAPGDEFTALTGAELDAWIGGAEVTTDSNADWSPRL